MAEENVVLEQYNKAEDFVKHNQKSISIIVAGAVLLVAAYFGYQKFVAEPNEIEANNSMFAAEQYFKLDSLDLALNGKGDVQGFLSIIEDYSATKAGNLAHYYAGAIYLKQGKFQDAIDVLEDFSTKDAVLASIALGNTADAYSELNDMDKAAEYYQKAADKGANDLTSPKYLLRLAHVLESQNNTEKALEVYQNIQTNYFETPEGQEVEKYIARANAKLGK